MVTEKVCVVKLMLAKLVAKVPRGYSKSTDKIFEAFLNDKSVTSEVKQFVGQFPGQKTGTPNEFLVERRWLDPANHKATMK